LVQDAGEWSASSCALFTPGKERSVVYVSLIEHLLVIRNNYHDFYFAVLFNIQTQRFCYNCIARLMFTAPKPVLLVFHFLATVAAIYVDPFWPNSLGVLHGRHHTSHLLRVLKSLLLNV
jgi:hypothetical protein